MQDEANDGRIEWLTIDDAATRLGMSSRTVQRRIAAGTMRASRRPDGRTMVAVTVPPPSGDVALAVGELRQQAAETRRVAAAVVVQGEQAIEAWRGRAEIAEAAAGRARRRAVAGWALAGATLVVAVVAGMAAAWKTAEAAATGRQASDAVRQAEAARSDLAAAREAVAAVTASRQASDAELVRVLTERDRLAAELRQERTANASRPPRFLAVDPIDD